jgi:hypothetical protein
MAWAAWAGLSMQSVRINADNVGLALWPEGSPPPVNPSGSAPFVLSVLGDSFLGDVYCLADEQRQGIAPGSWGCVYGKAVGDRVGPIQILSGKGINLPAGEGGPGLMLWADRLNIDGYGNRGYMDLWAWGQPDSPFSNTLNFGNRGLDGTPTRRFRILGDGRINLPDLAGTGVARLCIGPDGTLQRGGC